MSNLPSKKTSADFTFKHSGQADGLGASLGGNVSEVQSKFDSRAIDNQDEINEILDSLVSTDGATQIGLNATGVVATNVRDGIAEVQSNIASTALGEIPNNTITELKMAAEMKKQAGGVAEYDTVVTQGTSIGINTSNITTIENDLDILRIAKDSTGSANAYILDTPAVFDYAIDGNLVNFNPNFTNTGTSTIAIDGTTKGIRKFDVDTNSYVILEENDIKKNNSLQLRFDVSEDFFVLAPKSGAKEYTTTIDIAGVGGSATSQRVDVVGNGIVKNIFSVEPSAIYDYYFVIDGTRYPTSGRYACDGNNNLLNLDMKFNSSFQFYSENEKLQCTYELNGSAGHSVYNNLSQSVALTHQITGKGILVASYGDYHSIEIDGVFMFGSATVGRGAYGQYWNVPYNVGVKLYTRAADVGEKGLIYKT